MREVARAHGRQLAEAKGPSALLLPLGGCGEWDRPGAGLHNPKGLAAFCDEIRAACPPSTRLHAPDTHINDPAFAEAALAIFDAWCAEGLIAPARPA